MGRMMWGAALLVLAGRMTAAQAVDGPVTKPLIGPIPAWVTAQTPAPLKDDGTAARILLQDQQVRFERGQTATFSETVIALETAQGLAAGNVAFTWNPDTQTPVVHRLVVRRGGQTIDLLASQSFTVLRREQNLESAMLDGMLTATLQPEGLQVGDVVDFAITVTARDPALDGHVEQVGGGWNGMPIGRAHLSAQWPAALPIRIQAGHGLPPLSERRQGELRVAEISANDLPVLPPPNGAPPRFARFRFVEMTDFASWASLGQLMTPLFARAATLAPTGPLHDEWAKLDAGARDPKAKAAAMLGFVQDRVRYVALVMGAGGYVPADASTTWSRRFGDCKAKTALLLALLHASGVEAVPVVVNAGGGDGLPGDLPLLGLFNHVLVRATIAGRTYWLDGTRQGDGDLDRLRVPNFRWGLPLLAKGAALVRLDPSPLDRPDEDRVIAIDASNGITLPAPFTVELVLRGDMGLGTDLTLRRLNAADRNRNLRDYWRKQYAFVEPDKVDARFDAQAAEEHLTMSGTARMEWNKGWYETDGTGLGWEADFHRDPGADEDAPFAVAYPLYTRVKESITLPPNFHFKVDHADTDVNQVVAGIEYRRTVSADNGRFVVEAIMRGIAPEFPASEAATAQAALRKMAGNNVFLGRPDTYQPTRAELDAQIKAAPTAAAYLQRAYAEAQANHQQEEIADATQALALEPKNETALAMRGMAHAQLGDADAAERDFALLDTINPRNATRLRARGLLALNNGDPYKAVDLLTRSLASENEPHTLGLRAQAYFQMRKDEAGLADASSALARLPQWLDLYLAKVNALQRQHRKDDVYATVAQMLAANPQVNYAQVIAARTYAKNGDRAAAMAAFDRALAIKPEAYIYLNRGLSRPQEDLTGRQADFRTAQQLDPADPQTATTLAWLHEDAGDHAAALQDIAPALDKLPANAELLVARGIIRDRTGQPALAERDFVAARTAASGNAADLNNLCWTKATRGASLPSALTDCDASLAKEQDAGTLDSRALVNLRLGRLDAALADYDAALDKAPKMPSSLYGRALVRRRRGETALADADAKAALALDPTIEKTYAGYLDVDHQRSVRTVLP